MWLIWYFSPLVGSSVPPLIVLFILSTLTLPYCCYASIDAPMCRHDLSTVQDGGDVMFAFLVIIFIISLLIFPPILRLTAIFHKLTLHPWRESFFKNDISPIWSFLHPFYSCFLHRYFCASSYYALIISCLSSISPFRV